MFDRVEYRKISSLLISITFMILIWFGLDILVGEFFSN